MKKLNHKQQGFALLEAMLGITVILVASIGVVQLYLSAKANSDLQKTEEITQQVASAAQQYLTSSYDPADTVTADLLIKGGLLPEGIVINNNGTSDIRGPFGTFDVGSVTGGEKQQFYVTVDNLPKKQAVDFCQHMLSNFAVFTGDTVSATSVPISILSDCAAKIDELNDRQSITIGAPKTAW